jgi:hypothetical protein
MVSKNGGLQWSAKTADLLCFSGHDFVDRV